MIWVGFNLFFRNFKKPMAVQDKKNEQHYINTYNVSTEIVRIILFGP